MQYVSSSLDFDSIFPQSEREQLMEQLQKLRGEKEMLSSELAKLSGFDPVTLNRMRESPFV